MLVAALAFGNSMTVFAYRDTFHQEVSEDTSQDEMVEALRVDHFTFTPDGQELKEIEPLKEIEMIYDRQFVDAEGNSYPYSDEETAAADRSCSHDFVYGTAADHTKMSDGSCEARCIVHRDAVNAAM